MSFENFSKKIALTLGIIKVALVAAFFLSYSLIAPQATLAEGKNDCKGTDLLEKLKAEDAPAYEKIIKLSDVVLNGNSIFWKIEKEGLPVSYLFGTMHMADPEIATLRDELKSVIDSSDTVVIESLDILDPEAAKAQMSQISHLMLLKKGTLKDLVRDDLEDELADAVSKRGLPMMLANRMSPWLIATTIAMPVCELERKEAGEKVLDVALADYAKSKSKSVKGLETITEQFTAMASISQEYHVSALEETLENSTLALDMIETLKATYKKGEMGVVFPIMEHLTPRSTTQKSSADFQKILIEKRNYVMVERALPILEKEKTVLAIGALHLSGETGIVELLRKEGFTVTSAQ